MEIEEFIEQDILAFLDDRLDKQHSTLSLRQRAPIQSKTITRDYEYEFFMMLDRKDLDGAKRVLHELKATFDECSNNMPEKLQLKSLLLDLYEKFKDHLDAQTTFNRIDARLGEDTNTPPNNTASAQGNLAAPSDNNNPRSLRETIATMNDTSGGSDNGLAPVPAPEFSAPKPTATILYADNHGSENAPGQRTPAERASQEERITAYLDMIDTLLAKNEIRNAVSTYHDAKRIALGMETINDTIAKQFIAAHTAIHNSITTLSPSSTMNDAMNDARSKPAKMTIVPNPTITTPKAPLNQVPADNRPPSTRYTQEDNRQDDDRDILIAMEGEKRALDAYLDRYDIANAMRSYRRMRLLAQQLRSKTNAERVSIKLASLHQIISQMKAHTASDGAEKKGKTLAEARP